MAAARRGLGVLCAPRHIVPVGEPFQHVHVPTVAGPPGHLVDVKRAVELDEHRHQVDVPTARCLRARLGVPRHALLLRPHERAHAAVVRQLGRKLGVSEGREVGASDGAGEIVGSCEMVGMKVGELEGLCDTEGEVVG